MTGLRRNTHYYVRAYATNINGTAYGNQQVFTTLRFSQKDLETTDTIISNIGSSTLEIYPDPAISIVTVAFYLAEKSIITLSIHDICGRNIFQEQLNDQPSGPQKMQFDTSSLKEGIYMVTVTTDKMVSTRKFIKID